MYECSKSGAVRNKHTLKLRPVEASPRPGDPHVYVRLVLKDSERQHGSNKQKRLALRNVVANAWVPGFTLTAEGHPNSNLRVYHKKRNPTDCRAANLVILTEQQAHSQGLNLTRSRSRGDVCCSSLVLSITAGSRRFPAVNSQSISVPFGLVNSKKKKEQRGQHPHTPTSS
jgi:hypothetical protein